MTKAPYRDHSLLGIPLSHRFLSRLPSFLCSHTLPLLSYADYQNPDLPTTHLFIRGGEARLFSWENPLCFLAPAPSFLREILLLLPNNTRPYGNSLATPWRHSPASPSGTNSNHILFESDNLIHLITESNDSVYFIVELQGHRDHIYSSGILASYWGSPPWTMVSLRK